MRNENLALESGNAAQSPRFEPLRLGSVQERGGGIVGLHPASEPLLSAAWVNSVKSSRAVLSLIRAPRGVFIPFSPPVFFRSPLTRPPLAHWPPGEARGYEGIRADHLLPLNSCFCLGALSHSRIKVAMVFYFKSVFKPNISVDPQPAFVSFRFSSLAFTQINHIKIPCLEGDKHNVYLESEL